MTEPLQDHKPVMANIQSDVLLPFVGSRIVLVIFGFIAQVFPPYFNYRGDGIIERGWHFTSWKWVDFWARWDSAWYLNIIQNGYELQGDPALVKSNIAFYPLYPYLVEGLAQLLPGPPGLFTYLAVGLIISNLAAVTALVLIYKLGIFYLQDRKTARYTVWFMLAFPSAFILSCFYTEALFLCLAAGALWFGSQQKWAPACLAIMLAAVSRPVGLGLALPVAYMYMESRQWKIQKISWDILWFLITPLAYIYFLYHIELVTGDFMTTFQVQQAWDRHFSWPWKTLFYPNGWNLYHTPIQQLLTLMVFGGIYWGYRLLPTGSLAIMAFIILLPIYFTGRLSSCIRYYLMAFPVFMAYSVWIKQEWILKGLLIGAALLQIVYFMGWVRFYWIM